MNKENKIGPSELAEEFDINNLYPEFVMADTYEYEKNRRRRLKGRAKKLIEEYENMSEEEKEEFEEKHNRDGKYTKEQLKEIADSEVEVPNKFNAEDLKARPISECRKIMEALMENFDPTKGRPVWKRANDSLHDDDISISPGTLKRFWTAIQEKDAYQIVKEKIYWDIFEEADEIREALEEHIIDRIGGKGEEFDGIEDRMNAYVKWIETLKDLPREQPQQVEVKKEEKQTKNVVFKDFSEEQEENIRNGEPIDVDEVD